MTKNVHLHITCVVHIKRNSLKEIPPTQKCQLVYNDTISEWSILLKDLPAVTTTAN